LRDAVAGLGGAISSIPDGMACGLLAGVNPVYGLYASSSGAFFGGLATSTTLMVVTTTSAAALATGSALESVPLENRDSALVLLTILGGLLMWAAAALRVARYTRFISHSVMIGFLTGISATILISQIPTMIGVSTSGPSAFAKALDLVTELRQIDLASLVCGALALTVVGVLGRTRFVALGALGAIAIPSVVVSFPWFDGVAQVRETGDLPTGLPMPEIPELSMLSPELIAGAASVALIVLVQGVGVRESVPEPSRKPNAVSRDFSAQGLANVASGFFQGMPVGGSVSATSLNIALGARTRWAAAFRGVFVLVLVLAAGGLIGRVPMPALAALLIYAAVMSIRPREIVSVFRAGGIGRVTLLITALATLLLPVATAVGVGVALSLVLQLNRDSIDMRIVELEPTDDGGLRELDPPIVLHSDHVTVLDVYGSLLYAGAHNFANQLPPGTDRVVVVLRLRGRVTVGVTFMKALVEYARRLDERGGHMYVSGVDPVLMSRYREKVGLPPCITVVEAESVLGRSTLHAFDEGMRWLAAQRDSPDEE
jgi:SulP family sulfate permease